jgi:hypothetical protein
MLEIEEAEELLAKTKLASGQKQKFAKLIRTELPKGNETDQASTSKSRQRIGTRHVKDTSMEQQILASGPIFRRKLQECFFEIDEYRIKGVSTAIGDGTFEGFWSSVGLGQLNSFQQRCKDFREYLLTEWLAQVAGIKINKGKSAKKRVNRWEYINCWR